MLLEFGDVDCPLAVGFGNLCCSRTTCAACRNDGLRWWCDWGDESDAGPLLTFGVGHCCAEASVGSTATIGRDGLGILTDVGLEACDGSIIWASVNRCWGRFWKNDGCRRRSHCANLNLNLNLNGVRQMG